MRADYFLLHESPRKLRRYGVDRAGDDRGTMAASPESLGPARADRVPDDHRLVLRGHRPLPGKVSGFAARPDRRCLRSGAGFRVGLPCRGADFKRAAVTRDPGGRSRSLEAGIDVQSGHRGVGGALHLRGFPDGLGRGRRALSRQRPQRQHDVAAGGGGRRRADGFPGVHGRVSLHGRLRALRHRFRPGASADDEIRRAGVHAADVAVFPAQRFAQPVSGGHHAVRVLLRADGSAKGCRADSDSGGVFSGGELRFQDRHRLPQRRVHGHVRAG